jgi:hypothetical protein
VIFKATMTSAAEVPTNTSTGTGTFTGTLDTVTNEFVYDLTFTGLTSGVNNGHIHGPNVSATTTAGTTVNFTTLAGGTFGTGATTGTGHGSVILDASTNITTTMKGDSLKKLLFAPSGTLYVNIHTVNNPGGEIRGTLVKQ